MAVRRTFLEFHFDISARRLTAFEQHVGDLSDRSSARDRLEAAVAQHGGFERELRRKSGTHLLFAARRSGLVVEDDVAPVGIALDAVGDAPELECAVLERNRNLTADFRLDGGNGGAARGVPARNPMRDAEKARPPERARFRSEER